MSAITENEARVLRAACYGDVSDESWEKLKPVWTQPDKFKWLQQHSRIPPICPPGLTWQQWNGHKEVA